MEQRRMLSAIIGAASNVVGGLLGAREKDKDRDAQRQFAQQGVQWKVADAKKAGVHPLYALGAQTHSFAPVSTGSADLSTAIPAAGQDISRAVHATSPAQTRFDAYETAARALSLEKAGLENDYLRSQIAKVTQTLTPAMPTPGQRYLVDGQGPTALVDDNPLKRVVSDPGQLHSEPGAITDQGFARTAGGGYAPVMSFDVKQRLEEDVPGMLFWNIRNRLLPTLGSPWFHQSPPNIPLREDEAWYYNPLVQEYRTRKYHPRKIGYY